MEKELESKNGEIPGKTEVIELDSKSTKMEESERTQILLADESQRQVTNSMDSRKLFFGFLIVIGIAVSWVGATQFSQSTYSPTFFAPLFNVWFSTTWMIICYPVFQVGVWIIRPWPSMTTKDVFRNSAQVFGRSGLTVKTFCAFVIPFTICWFITNYINTAFIYIFSWLWLQERLALLPAKGTSVLLSILGIVLISYAEGFEGPSLKGSVLSVASAIGAAIYKVLFKRYVGDANYGQVSLFLTLLGLFNAFVLWPSILAVYYTGFEYWEWNDMPWDYLCGSAAMSVVFNFLINFGIAVTFPLFIALGTVVGIPLNAVVDLVFRDNPFGPYKIGGTACIILGFLIMLMPEKWQEMASCCYVRRVPAEGTTPSAGAQEDRERTQDHNTSPNGKV
ncbi:putative thiamine transporter SLC35F3 isoform X2 [Apostichopus japonicus]|uniref:Putative thiamine transporter SLC35F3 isoform X2 n=1 Tax=Stichopus japonicus TaxID=307972 RepID=A0A2G8L684_STIJA|nr:putative thiamine transporter SLC35F3 isoform X2 [Apostichopus japonicus]